jgi:four helix bundle protein
MQNDRKDLPERTYQYGRRVIHLFESLPETKLALTLGLQLLRAGTSVGANYREANRARSKAEFISKMGDSLKELDESSLWLRHIADSEIVAPSRLKPLRSETDELIRIFVTIIKSARRE